MEYQIFTVEAEVKTQPHHNWKTIMMLTMDSKERAANERHLAARLLLSETYAVIGTVKIKPNHNLITTGLNHYECVELVNGYLDLINDIDLC